MRKKTPRKSRTRIRRRRIVALPAALRPNDAEFEYALVHHRVCRFFDGVQGSCAGRPECGGILIGRYRGPHIEVTDWTEPGPADLATRSSFTRQDKRHQDAATAAWRESKHVATYVGEWHSHPSGQPRPSGIDRTVWRNVVSRLRTPCLFAIVSPDGWEAFRVTKLISGADATALVRRENGRVGVVFV